MRIFRKETKSTYCAVSIDLMRGDLLFNYPVEIFFTIYIYFLQVGKDQKECLASCDDQVNNVGVTSSMFPNRETFVKREEFCITLMKLNRTCSSPKRPFLVKFLPTGWSKLYDIKHFQKF